MPIPADGGAGVRGGPARAPVLVVQHTASIQLEPPPGSRRERAANAPHGELISLDMLLDWLAPAHDLREGVRRLDRELDGPPHVVYYMREIGPAFEVGFLDDSYAGDGDSDGPWMRTRV